MARLFIVDARGARSADLATARERFDDENKKVFGADLDTNDHTPQNQIAGINALVATEMSEEFVRASLYGSSISYAPGTFLDALGSLLDIRRELGAKSRVLAKLTGVAGTLVPAGRLAKNADGDLFESEESVVIAEGGSIVGFVATNEGPINVDAGTLTQVVSVVSGWETINNEDVGIIGRARESDASYRANIRSRTAHSSIGSIAALESALRSAGATRIRIIENNLSTSTTKSGVTLPPHSIFVIVDGGQEDDIARAVENHRGMGVDTYTAFTGIPLSLSEAQKITNGRMRFNNSTISGFNLSGQSLNGMAERINNATSLASFGVNNNSLIAFHSWDSEDIGFSDVSGNIFESSAMLPNFVPVDAKASGASVYARFPSRIKSFSGASLKYTVSGAESTATPSSTTFVNDMVVMTFSSAINSSATDLKLSASTVESHYKSEPALVDHPVELVSVTNTPGLPIATAEPRSQGFRISGVALGTVSSWQYRVFQNSAYIGGAGWKSLSNQSVLNNTTITNNGIDNDNILRIDFRAVNSFGNTAGQSLTVLPSNASPTIEDSHIDGNLITLTYNNVLPPQSTATPSGWSVGNTGGASVSVQHINVVGRNAYLRLSTNTSSGQSWTLTNTTGIATNNGTTTTTFSNRTLTNDTLVGVPSAPISVIASRTSTGWSASWTANYDGGLSIDRYEVSTLARGDRIWGPWVSTSITPTSYSFTTTSPPERVRVRASNPNARSASTLGLTGGLSPVPFTRSIPRPLSVGVEIYRDDTITTEDFESIKTSLIDLVNSYDIGSRLWQADLQAVVESIKSIRLASDLTVTSGGANINGVEQSAYTRWTLSATDIEITFDDD